MRGGTTGMNKTFRNALMVKMGDFFRQSQIFRQRWTPTARAQGVLVIGDAHALIGGKRKTFAAFPVWLKGVQFFVARIGGFQAARRSGLLARGCRFRCRTMGT